MIEGLSTEEVEAILFHELAHLKRNDFVINIIINVLQIVFFYHPAYWWMKSQLDNEREYATDELALKYSEKKLPMIKALAKVQAFSMNQPGLAFAGNSKNQVLKRINIMMNSKQQPNWLSAIFTIALLLVAFGLMSVHLFCLFITILWLLIILLFSKNEASNQKSETVVLLGYM